MKKIVLIGSGNVATHFGIALKEKGFNILQVWSYNTKNAKVLADKLKCEYTSKIENILAADLYILSIKDDSIINIIKKLSDIPIIHTSGSTSIDVFKNKFSKYGVIYPLQKFKKNIKINLTEIPLLIEANNHKFEKDLIYVASKLSKNTLTVSSKIRKQLHIAAVFASNFTNYMLTISEKILESQNLDFKLLLPLVNETINNLNSNSPSELQTGPAIRNEEKIIKMHLENLKDEQDKEIYSLISNAIKKDNE